MKPFIRPLAAALACAALLSTAPALAGAQTPDTATPDAARPGDGRRGRGRRAEMRERFVKELGLTDEQRSRIDQIRAADRDALRASHQAVSEKRQALRDAMLADPSNQAAIDERRADLDTAQSDLRRRALASEQRRLQVLTPEQRERIRAMRAERAGRGKHDKRDRLQRLR